MNIRSFFQSRPWSKIIYVLGIALVVLLIFQAGAIVGYRVAIFSHDWNQNYAGDAGDPRSVFAPFFRDTDSLNPHGAVGEIMSVNLPYLMIKGPQNNEEVIAIAGTTTVRRMRDTASTSDLRIGDQIIVIGSPDASGQIHAALIRIVPPRNPASPSPISPRAGSPVSPDRYTQ